MRHFSSVTRPVRRRTVIAGSLATFVGFALLACGAAVADTVKTDFESFNLGTVNGQNGWKSAPPNVIPMCPQTGGKYDQEVVSNSLPPAGFGQKSLRISNACTNGE